MCELLAISSRLPAAITYSLEEFSRNGSRLRSNRDGWGMALTCDRDAFLIKEPRPAGDSAWVQFAAENTIATHFAMAHVRYASRGSHAMENTHPFHRVLGRRAQLFAHNGTLDGIERATEIDSLAFFPVGDTDSELAFCSLLTRLQKHYANGEVPVLETRFEVFRNFCSDMRSLGDSNFLYHDGEVLFAHAHKRYYEEAGQMVGPRPPGLHLRDFTGCGHSNTLSCPGLQLDLQHQHTVVLASVPLDEQEWEDLEEGAVLAIRDGQVLLRGTSRP